MVDSLVGTDDRLADLPNLVAVFVSNFRYVRASDPITRMLVDGRAYFMTTRLQVAARLWMLP